MSSLRYNTVYDLLISVVFLVVLIDKTNGQGGSCRIQNNQPGICVPMSTCRTITLLLSNSPKPLPPSVVNELQSLHCGLFNNVHHGCCASNQVNSDTKTTTTSSPKTPTPNKRPGSEKSEADVLAGIGMLERTSCGKSDADRVANGEDANLSEYPWMALLIYSDGIDRTLDCGGSLIHPRYVLTAAHCIRSKKSLVSVRLGEHDTESILDCVGGNSKRRCAPAVQEIDVEEAIYHNNYNPYKFTNDVGILRLERNAEINTSVRPICLPITPRSRRYQIDRMIVSGWGRMENEQKATILQKAVVPIRSLDFCQRAQPTIKFTQEYICAGAENEVDACKGDSGGPLFYSAPYKKAPRYVQYGIVSAGTVKCGANSPGIYVKVEAYLRWIASNMEE